ncbi:MAG: T9SS type A sorting domain-containing protein [Chitinophagaceae bacterium]|nr:MAG: T9SS type A sorting domain-containing protein [Chitinophagaceae bacterium]
MRKNLLGIVIALASFSISTGQTIWSGPTITFSKAAFADPTADANQDRITNSTWITRASTRGLFNAAAESSYIGNISPSNTEWATGSLADYARLSYQPWEAWAGGAPNIPNIVGVEAVVHLIAEDIYLSIRFLSWGAGAASGGSFSYERSTAGTPAPVKLASFTASKKNSTVQLNWKTVSEENTSAFYVERSLDGKKFTKIGSVAASGNSSADKDYSFTDVAPSSMNFYRLQTIDNDGKFMYSRTLIFRLVKNSLLEVFPIPATSFLHVQVSSLAKMNIQLIDAAGRLQQCMTIASGESAFQLDISKLQPGIYYLKAGTETRTVIKQ